MGETLHIYTNKLKHVAARQKKKNLSNRSVSNTNLHDQTHTHTHEQTIHDVRAVVETGRSRSRVSGRVADDCCATRNLVYGGSRFIDRLKRDSKVESEVGIKMKTNRRRTCPGPQRRDSNHGKIGLSNVATRQGFLCWA